MNLISIALKSIRQRLLASSLTALSVALGVALMIAVLLANKVVSNTFDSPDIGYDLIVGPKGSELDLILSSVYRVSPAIGKLPWRYYEEDVKQHRHVGVAVPIAVGDRTEEGGFPIVGTTVEYFSIPYGMDDKGNEKPFRVRGDWPRGKWEAVIGSQVARENNWDVGSDFRMIHSGDDDHVHDERFTIVGVLEQTGTPNDRSAFVNLTGFFAISGHEAPIEQAIAEEARFYGETEAQIRERYKDDLAELAAHNHDNHDSAACHDHPVPSLQKGVTAVFVRMKQVDGRPTLAQGRAMEFTAQLKQGLQAQAVNPIRPMQRLMTDLVGSIRQLLLFLTGAIVVVSGIGIFVSIYNSMADRKREIAIMRALGADRVTVFSIILAEAVLLCLAGGLFGMLLGHGLIIFLAPVVASSTGLVINPYLFDPQELYIIPAVLGLAILVGILPGLTAYRTDVAENL